MEPIADNNLQQQGETARQTVMEEVALAERSQKRQIEEERGKHTIFEENGRVHQEGRLDQKLTSATFKPGNGHHIQAVDEERSTAPSLHSRRRRLARIRGRHVDFAVYVHLLRPPLRGDGWPPTSFVVGLRNGRGSRQRAGSRPPWLDLAASTRAGHVRGTGGGG